MVRTTFSAMLAAVAAGVLITSAPAFAQQSGSKDFSPTVGQPGKDVVWVPTPDEVVERMLRMAQVTPKDVVYDLGSGDGRTVIAAQKKFGARAKGIEFNPDMVELSRKNAAREGAKVEFVRGDVFAEDFSEATVITLYLLPSLNIKLRPKLELMAVPPRVRERSGLCSQVRSLSWQLGEPIQNRPITVCRQRTAWPVPQWFATEN